MLAAIQSNLKEFTLAVESPTLIRAKVSRPTTMKHSHSHPAFFLLLYELDSCEGLATDHDETPAFFFALDTGVVGIDSKDARSNPIKFERIYMIGLGGRDAAQSLIRAKVLRPTTMKHSHSHPAFFFQNASQRITQLYGAGG